MAKIQRKVLTLLEALYRFTSSQDGAPSEVQLGLGITPVHDLSRMAQIGAASINRNSAGFWLLSCTQAHTVTGTITTDMDLVDPAASQEGYSLNEREQWAWIIAEWLTGNDSTDFSLVQIAINAMPNDFFIGPSYGTVTNPNSVRQVIARYTSQNSGAQVGYGIRDTTTRVPLPQPILSPQSGFRMQSTSDSSGTITYNWNALLWIGLRSTFPPGVV